MTRQQADSVAVGDRVLYGHEPFEVLEVTGTSSGPVFRLRLPDDTEYDSPLWHWTLCGYTK